MSPVAPLLDDCLFPFFTLTTLLLAIGCGSMSLMRSPAHRQRSGELTLVAIFGWWILACLPLPRLLPERLWTQPHFRASVSDAMLDLDRGPSAAAMNELEVGSFDISEANETLLETRQLPVWDHGSVSAAPLGHAVVGRPVRDADSYATHVPSAGGGRSWITIVYLAGVGSCVLWLACGRIRLACIRRAARRPPAWLAQMFAELAEETGERPSLLVSRHSTRPMSWGTWHPTIVLPLALARRRHRERLRMVLLHELAHVVRRDGWGNRLLCLAFPLLYPHPLFLWLRAQVRLAAELLADDWAAQRAGKLAYVEQLVLLAKSSTRSPVPLPLAGAVTLYSSSSQFYRRMQMLMSRTCPLSVVPTTRWHLSSLVIAALAAVTSASMAGVRPAWSQQLSSEEQAASPPENPTKAPPSADSANVNGAKVPSEKDPSGAKVAVGEQQVALRRDILRAEADIVVAKQNLANAENKLHYARKMHRKGYVTELDVEEKESAVEKAKLDLEAAELSKQVLDRPLEKLPFVGRLFTVADAATALNEPTADEQALRARLAAAEERVRVLEAQLRKARLATLTRVEEDGSISQEIWLTDAEGHPAKLLSKEVTQPAGESPIAAAKTTVSQDGRVVKEFKGKDGTVTTHVYDRDTGKLIEAKHGKWGAGPAATKSADGAGQPKMGAKTSIAAAESSLDRPHASIGLDRATGIETAGLDLVKLATAYADAVGAVEEAEARMPAGGPDRDLRSASIALRSARRKQELLRNLASVAADAARADLERAQQLVRTGYATAESAAAAESRVKMLDAILQSGSSGDVESKQSGSSPKPE